MSDMSIFADGYEAEPKSIEVMGQTIKYEEATPLMFSRWRAYVVAKPLRDFDEEKEFLGIPEDDIKQIRTQIYVDKVKGNKKSAIGMLQDMASGDDSGVTIDRIMLHQQELAYMAMLQCVKYNPEITVEKLMKLPSDVFMSFVMEVVLGFKQDIEDELAIPADKEVETDTEKKTIENQ